MRPRTPLVSLLLLAGLAASAAPAAAQLISVRTIPLATGDQFLILPSARLGMGGVTLSVDDTVADAFVNPARGARLEEGRLFTAPAYYTIGNDLGSGRSLPVGAVGTGRRWFGGGALAVQQLTRPRTRGGWMGPMIDDVRPALTTFPSSDRLSDRTAHNLYAAGTLGRRLDDGRTALGASATYAGLDAMSGVDLLYPRSRRVEQGGSMVDVRLGALRELGGGAVVDLALLHNRVDMEHDVTYQSWRWDPVRRITERLERVERNQDHARTWGAHLAYRRPLGREGWRLGGILTANHTTHPKLPNYELMNIPRDPGTTWAYNVGAGVSRRDGPATFALDLVLEPIWSETWAVTDTTMRLPGGRTLAAGAHTVDNDFRFANALLRMGLERQTQRFGFQLGLEARTVRYRLEQDDHVLDRQRTQRESWMEWAPTWGAAARFPEFQVRYSGRVTAGTGFPGTESGPVFAADAAPLRSTFIPAPNAPLTLQETNVWTHQVAVSLPIR